MNYSQNIKWPFSLSKTRLQTGGWARQQNSQLYASTIPGPHIDDGFVEHNLPIASALAGVNMRLLPGAYRYAVYSCIVHDRVNSLS